MADILGGGAGLFSGLSQGLQLLLALRNAEADRALRARNTTVAESEDQRRQAEFDIEQANAPYLNQQDVLKNRGIDADLPAVRREYEAPGTLDTYQQAPFQAPTFGSAPQQSGPPAPLPNLQTSHMAQVLERANRLSMHQRKLGTLDAILGEAAKQAQSTQLPVSGAFDTPEGRVEMPQGFTAQPDKTFTPYQLSGRPDPLDNIFGPLLNNPVNAKILQKTDPITYKQFEAWKARRIGGGAGAPSGGSIDVQTIIDQVISEHPSWTDQQVADEVRRRMGSQ